MHTYPHLHQVLNNALQTKQTNLNNLLPPQLYQPMGYIIGLGGKRVRPLLTLIACELFNADANKAIDAALAVELFHNFSLIHDDILDNAPLRRGNQTVHEKWNTNIAILSGDGMMVKAFEVLAKCDPANAIQLFKLFSKTGLEVCEGQQLDMNFETQQNVSVKNYIDMITFKTAVLLGCSLQMGAICANASANEQAHIYEFGKHIGIAFQLLDDVLDVYASADKFGKQVGGDIISNKKTFLLLSAFELGNQQQTERLSNLLANNTLSNSDKVTGVTEIYNQLNIKNLANAEANKHTEIALNHLAKLNVDASKKEHLKQFALQLLNREV